MSYNEYREKFLAEYSPTGIDHTLQESLITSAYISKLEAELAEARKEVERLAHFKKLIDRAWDERAWPSTVMHRIELAYQWWKAQEQQGEGE